MLYYQVEAIVEINEIHDIELLPNIEIENYAIALKNNVLFTTVDENKVAAVCLESISISFDFLSSSLLRRNIF